MYRPVVNVACCGLLLVASVASAVEETKMGGKMEGGAMAMEGTPKMSKGVSMDSTMQMIDDAIASNDPAKMKDVLTKTRETLSAMSAHSKMKMDKMGSEKMSTDKMAGDKVSADKMAGDSAGKM